MVALEQMSVERVVCVRALVTIASEITSVYDNFIVILKCVNIELVSIGQCGCMISVVLFVILA